MPYFDRQGNKVNCGDIGFVVLTPDLLKFLHSQGELIERPDIKVKTQSEIPSHISFYINKFAQRFGFTDSTDIEFQKMFKTLYSHAPYAVVDLLLKGVATELDKKYEDHIKNCKQIYVISRITKEIIPLNLEGRSNIDYRAFTAFRNKEDAKFALDIVSSWVPKK